MAGDDIMSVLDASFPWVSETFVGPFGLLAYQADELRLNPYDERARVRYGTTYFLWIEGVLALSVMKVTLSYARGRGLLPAYCTGFTANTFCASPRATLSCTVICAERSRICPRSSSAR